LRDAQKISLRLDPPLTSNALTRTSSLAAEGPGGADLLQPPASKLTLSEVARLTGSSPASARRSLHTLHALDYLESDGKRFWVAPRALLVAHAYLASRPTPQLAQPLLDSLAERTRQSASLGKLLDDDVIIIARSTARRSLSTGLGIGSRLLRHRPCAASCHPPTPSAASR
jgi:DNA-binding IclR family transcriptional regulator